VGMIIWLDKPIGVLVHNISAAESYDSFFNMMWKNSFS